MHEYCFTPKQVFEVMYERFRRYDDDAQVYSSGGTSAFGKLLLIIIASLEPSYYDYAYDSAPAPVPLYRVLGASLRSSSTIYEYKKK